MALTSGFFNSKEGDIKYNARQVGQLFDGIITDGIFSTVGDAFSVTPSGSTGYSVNIGTGRAWFNHTWLYNDDIYKLTLDTPSAGQNRIDLICLFVNDAERTSSFFVVKGTATTGTAVIPSVPDDRYHPIARVNVRNDRQTQQIVPGDITYGISPMATGVLQQLSLPAIQAKWEDIFNRNENGRISTFNSNESARATTFSNSESSRATTFTNSENGRKSTFDTNESSRASTFTTNESARQSTFDTNEAKREKDEDDLEKAFNDWWNTVKDVLDGQGGVTELTNWVAKLKAKFNIDSNNNILRLKTDATNYVTAGQKSGTTLGANATAEGTDTESNSGASHAEGMSTKAANVASHAEGDKSTASGGASHAEGGETTASGGASHSEGMYSIASGQGAHAEGERTKASGKDSHAEGSITTASGKYSHTEGNFSQAEGLASHAEGITSYAKGDCSHAEGTGSYAEADYSHAEGVESKASGEASHAEGHLCKASNKYAHAEGETTVASGLFSHAEGGSAWLDLNDIPVFQTTASGEASHAEGEGSIASGYGAHAEGFVERYSSNVGGSFKYDGSITASGKGAHAEGWVNSSTFTKASGNGSHAEGIGTTASGNGSHAEGDRTNALGNYSHSEGSGSYAIGDESHAEGGSSAQGYSSHAEISGRAVGNYSHAEGISFAYGRYSHTEGSDTTTGDPDKINNSGTASHAEGYSTVAIAHYSHAEGSVNAAYGTSSHVEGSNCDCFGDSSHAEGDRSHSNGYSSHAEGYGCSSEGTAAHAQGCETYANGYYSFTTGQGTIAKGQEMSIFGRFNASPLNNDQYKVNSYNASNGALVVGNGTSDSARSNCFRVTSTTTYGKTYSTSGADYAEMFEWKDGNPNAEDRAGMFVTLDGPNIVLAKPSDDYILGVVSGNPSVCGDVYDDQWSGMYDTDIFGRPLFDIYKREAIIDTREEPVLNDDGTYKTDGDGKIITETKTIEIVPAGEDECLKLSSDYDNTKKYIPRSDRPEWDPVGLLGKLVCLDDGTAQVNHYVKCNENSIATHSDERTKYRVMERLDEAHIRIMIL